MGFSLLKQSKILDPSRETDLDFWDCLRKEKQTQSNTFTRLIDNFRGILEIANYHLITE